MPPFERLGNLPITNSNLAVMRPPHWPASETSIVSGTLRNKRKMASNADLGFYFWEASTVGNSAARRERRVAYAAAGRWRSRYPRAPAQAASKVTFSKFGRPSRTFQATSPADPRQSCRSFSMIKSGRISCTKTRCALWLIAQGYESMPGRARPINIPN